MIKARGTLKSLISLILTSLMVLSSFSLATFITARVASSNTIRVPQDYPTIQAAINAASSGDTIFVSSGIYYENVVVNKTITLQGEDKRTTVIDGSGNLTEGSAKGPIVKVAACNVTISGFTIQNTGWDGLEDYGGVYMHGVVGCVIKGNQFVSCDVGVFAVHTNSTKISENFILGNSNVTDDNEDSYYFRGIDFESCYNCIVARNIIMHYMIAIDVDWGSSNNTFTKNHITNNLLGVEFWYAGKNNTISNNYFVNNTDYNIVIDSASNTIETNFIDSSFANGASIYVKGNENAILGNTISNEIADYYDAYSCIVIEGDRNRICGNNVISYSDAICVEVDGDANVIEFNEVRIRSGCAIGLDIRGDGNVVQSNEVVEARSTKKGGYGYGLNLRSFGSPNIVRGNTIRNCNYTLFVSGLNWIYHNNFMECNEYVAEVVGSSTWDDGYPSGGNYWGDYTGIDLYSGLYQNETGSDGIGDTPYVIDDHNKDRYPLMKPWTPQAPDLVVTNFIVSNLHPKEGENITITVTISNTGVEGAENVQVDFIQHAKYQNPILGDYKVVLLSLQIDSILPSDSVTLEVSWNAVETLNIDDKPLKVILDPANKICELNETNNEASINGFLSLQDTSKFDVHIDGYSFKNWAFSPEELKDLKREMELYLKSFSALPDIILSAIVTLSYPSLASGGHCYGMAATSILYYKGIISKPVDKNTFFLSKEEVVSDIAAYHTRQLFFVLHYIIKEALGINLRDEYVKIKSNLEKDQPLMLLLNCNEGKHAVTLFNVYNISDDIVNLVVYDNNFPGMGNVITFDLKNNKIYSPTYNIKTAFVDLPAPYPIDVIRKIIDDFIKSLIQKLESIFVFESPVDITIVDEYGRTLSNDKNEIPGARLEYYDATETKILYMPLNLTYNIFLKAYGSGNCTITQITPTSAKSAAFSRLLLNVTSNTSAVLSVQQNIADYLLHVDVDGDGIIDYDMFPQTAYYQLAERLVHEIFIDERLFHVITESNSTITDLAFLDSDEKKIIFYVEGQKNTMGFCNITIPKDLLNAEPLEGWAVSVDGQPISPTIVENTTHTFIYITYNHSIHYVEIEGTWAIPEFPTVGTLLVALLVLFTLIVSLVKNQTGTVVRVEEQFQQESFNHSRTKKII